MSSGEIQLLRDRYEALQLRWDERQEFLGRLQEDVFDLRNALVEQSQFCARVGVTLGVLLWRATRFPDLTELLLQFCEGRLTELMLLTDSALGSFQQIRVNRPPEGSAQAHFIVTLCGIVSNLAATAEGRRLFDEKLILRLIKLIDPELQSPQSIHRLVLMALYNITMPGSELLRYIKNHVKMIVPFISCCLRYGDTDNKTLGLKLLINITTDMTDEKTILYFKESAPIQVVYDLANNKTACEHRNLAQQTISNIEKAIEKCQTAKEEMEEPNNKYRCYFLGPQRKCQ